MNKALEESGLDAPVVAYLKAHFADAANFMRNQAED
jgi:hypothetical protein